MCCEWERCLVSGGEGEFVECGGATYASILVLQLFRVCSRTFNFTFP